MRHALWLALPLQILMVWVAHQGWVHYRRNLEFANDPQGSPSFDIDQWRYFTKLEFERSVYRAIAPDVVPDDLETINLTIDRRHIGSLNSSLPESGKTKYYPAVLAVDGQSQRVKTRYMGDNHWHWLYPQKSWKVRTRAGDPLRDRRSFNLKNPPTVLALEDIIANELAAEIGLISPAVYPVKMFVNGAYSGLHLWWDIVDESLLRRFRRMPGSLYSGDGAPRGKDGVGRLFFDERYWVKDGARNAQQAEDRSDITALIAAIQEFDATAFRDFADQHLDLDQFARFTALDRLFGGQHHDYNHNHKIYFDPYKGRFEPIEWDFAYWRLATRAPGLDQALNPLLSRIREQPEYELRIQQALHELRRQVSPQRVHDRIDRAVARVRSALAADGFRDARDNHGSGKLRLSRLHCAFFSDREYGRRLERMKSGYSERYDWLGERLADSVLQSRLSLPEAGVAGFALQSSGLVGQRLLELAATTDAASVELVRDRNRNGVIDPGERPFATAETEDGVARFELDELLLPGLRKVASASRWPSLYGTFDLVPASLRYGYLLRPSNGRITAVSVRAINAVTAAEVVAEPVAEMPAPEATFSQHPWDLPFAPVVETIELGPGELVIDRSMTLAAQKTVVIRPGTTLRLGPGVNIEILGKVIAEGTAEAPIRFEPAIEGRAWGVFALHGMGTRGSRLTHCHWRDGSTATLRMVLRTGMVSIIDTADIVMRQCVIGRNFVGDDGLHWGYVAGGEIRDCEFRDAFSDAFDIDISNDIRIVGCHFEGSGNDAVDLMTSKAEIADCHFVDAGDKGVSVGEDSRLELLRSQFDGCVIGIEIKDRSIAQVDARTRIRDCGVGINLYRKNPRYSLGGTLRAEQLWITGTTKPLTKDKRSTVEVDVLHTTPSRD